MNRHMRSRRPRSALFMVILAALVGLGAPVRAWAALTASTANLTLASIGYSHVDQTSLGSLTLEARDTGTTTCILFICSTTNDGWNVTLQASNFAYTGTNNGAAIPAANLAVTQAHPPTRVSGDAISGTGGPRTTNVTGSLDTPRKTLQADDGFGIGTYRQVIDVSLLVPGQARAGTYTTTLTVTISSGP